MIKLQNDEICVVQSKESGENCGYKWNVKFLSLEGYDICWKKEQAEQFKKQLQDDYEKSRVLSKIDEYCTGRETIDVITLLSLGLRGRGE